MKNEETTITPERQQGIQFHVSLRDYFAAKALCLFSLGEKEIKRLEDGERLDHRSVAACCYALADAMLAERAK